MDHLILPGMKRLYLFGITILALIVLAGCNDMKDFAEPLETTIVLTATYEGVSPDTKTLRMDDGSTWWNPTEEISVFYGSGSNGGSKFISKNTTIAETAEFEGSISMSGSQEFWAVYPYSTENSCDGSSITTVIPATQTGVEGNFSDDAFPAMGKSSSLTMPFYNICGGIKFFVSRADIKSITFKGNNGEALAGKVKVVFGTDGKPEVAEVIEGKTEVTLTAPDGGTFKAGKYYYLTLLPGVLDNGFTMTFFAVAETGTLTSNQSQAIKRCIFGTLKNVDSMVTEWESTIIISGSPKPAGITYQINVYSFADSDGDGWGDIKGITQHLDYLDQLGVSALWLSPIQPSESYHGYDILDYYTVNPKLGTEADLQELIDKAREKNIDIYLDYVLNHSGRGEWFYNAVSNPEGPYRSYYVLSDDPAADVAAGKVDNFGGSKTPGMGEWYNETSGAIGYEGRLHFMVDWGAKTVTVTETSEAAQTPNADATLWLWIGSAGSVGLYPTASNIHEITIDVDTDWGFLVRSSITSWDNGTKWGGDGTSITFGEPYPLNSSPALDITFGGAGIWYFATFGKYMPDLNYGPYDKVYESPAFKDLASSADRWINMGVNGFRLDAVNWIYQNQTAANVSFLQQWYDRCNNTFKARGGQGNFYMVGEAWEDASKVASYYQGLPSLFNFDYWFLLKDRINSGKGSDFASTVIGYRNLFKAKRADAIDAIKLSNHDENRVGSDLGKDFAKIKLAGAVLLTSSGKPFVYQGEELGYWGTQDHGSEYVRTPIKWTRGGNVPSGALSGRIDYAMLNESISVEAQEADEASVLSVYKRFTTARNSHPALYKGEMTEVTSPSNPIAVWTMTADGETVLVVHNFGGSETEIDLQSYKTSDCLVSNGECTPGSGTVTLGAYASAVFLQ